MGLVVAFTLIERDRGFLHCIAEVFGIRVGVILIAIARGVVIAYYRTFLAKAT